MTLTTNRAETNGAGTVSVRKPPTALPLPRGENNKHRAKMILALLASRPMERLDGWTIAEILDDGSTLSTVRGVIMQAMNEGFEDDYSHVYRGKTGRVAVYWYDPDVARKGPPKPLRVPRKAKTPAKDKKAASKELVVAAEKRQVRALQAQVVEPTELPMVLARVVLDDPSGLCLFMDAEGRVARGRWLTEVYG